MEKDLNENNGLTEEEAKVAEEPSSQASSPAEDDAVVQGGSPKKANGKPLSKQTLIRIIAIAAAAVVAVVVLTLGLVLGLRKEDAPKEYSVEFKSAEHVVYSVTDYADISASGKITVAEGTQITFSLVLDENYESPVVTANTVVLSESEGVYSLTVSADTVVSVSGLVDNSVTLKGSGTSTSPFIVNDLRELDYVAARVNRGDSSYVLGYFELGSDIDCGGANLNTIGDGSTESSFFAGQFDGKGHTVSNYVINSVNRPYAGFFGFVEQYATSTSNDENSGTVKNLNLKNFEIYAHAPEGSNVIAGSIAGYAMAAKILNCSALEGTITIIGNNYFSYSGGAVGMLQSGTTEGMDDQNNRYLESYYAVINGVHTNVDLYTAQGFSYASGGIASFVMSDHAMTPAYITNCYSEGRIFNAMRVGGIAGYISDYSSIANCYSAGELRAQSNTDNDVSEYDALAGGITSYAGVDSIISNSFSVSKLWASSSNGALHAKTGGIIASFEEPSVISKSVTVYNCFSGADAKYTEASFIRDTLNWSDSDWIIKDGSAPVLGGNVPSDITVTIKADYGTEQVDGKAFDDIAFKVNGYYFPVIDHYRYDTSDLVEVMTSDGEETSYGYFFDADRTQAVPYGFVPTNDITLYAGFADYSAVEGAYTLIKNGRTLTLTLYKSGEFTYVDGITFASTFTYNGRDKKIIFYDAPFARLSNVISDGEPDLNFELYGFAAKLVGDKLSVYDGEYFKDDAPLEFTAAGSTASVDQFAGKWEKSATINRVYEFVSLSANSGNWTYSEPGKSGLHGTYSINNHIATLLKPDNSLYASARIAESGLIQLALGLSVTDVEDFTEQNSEYFGCQSGLLGTWFDTDTGDYVIFNGYGSSFAGSVVVNVGGNASRLEYIKDGFFDGEGADGYGLTLISPTTGALFGYLNYDKKTNVLDGMLYNANTGGFAGGYNFRLVDNYSGEWIGKDSISDVDFKLLNFNGFGTYSAELSGASAGYVEINGGLQRIEYSADISAGLVGKFTYNQNEYTLKYNEQNSTVTVTDGSESAILYRKDELYGYTLVTDSTFYTFNGGGKIGAGIMTVSQTRGTVTTVTEYEYEIISGTVEGKDIEVRTKNIKTQEEGTLTVSGNYFLFKEKPSAYGATLSVRNSFVGSWSISRWFQPFTVNNFDLDGAASGKFQGFDATYATLSDTCILVSYYQGESTSLTSSYIVLVDDDTLAISDYPYLVSGGYYYAARQDGLFGEWTHVSRTGAIQFDGLGYSKYAFGAALDLATGESYYYTYRFGKYYMWLFEDDTKMSVVNFYDRFYDGDDYYSLENSKFSLEEFDAASTAVFKSKDEKYEFYIDGTVLVDGAIRAYDLVEIDGDETTLIIRIDGEEDITAVVNDGDGTVTVL